MTKHKNKKNMTKNTFKVSLVLILLMFIGNNVYSQKTAFGLKGGINTNTIILDDPEATYDSRTGYHAGLFLRGRMGNMGIQPELLIFANKGEIKSSVFGTAEESFTYLTIPLMLKFYPVMGLNFQAGPQFAFIIDGERKYETFLGSATEDITDHYKSSDFSLSLGAGYDFKWGLNLDIRYNIGLKDINNAADGEEAKSKIFLISAGWNFLN